MQTFHIRENSPIARIAAWKLSSSSVAIVIGRTVHLHNTKREDFTENKQWLRHELTHIEQFRRYGWLRFICLYLIESARSGYQNNRYEIEARLSESDEKIEKAFRLTNK